jgi:Alpha/beta hydrolase domain
LATYTGWGLRAFPAGGNDGCDAAGQKIDFALTKADRLGSGDPHLSIEERYPYHSRYAAAVAHAANQLHRQRLLLEEDVSAYIAAASQSTVGK